MPAIRRRRARACYDAASPFRAGAIRRRGARRGVHQGDLIRMFDEFKRQLPDADEAETQDWLGSLDSLVEERGPERARFLLHKLLKRARQLHVGLPSLT